MADLGRRMYGPCADQDLPQPRPRAETIHAAPEAVIRRRRFKLSTTRARLGSMPSRFVQTDEELQKQRRALKDRLSETFSSSTDVLPWNKKSSDTEDDGFDILAGKNGCCDCGCKFCGRLSRQYRHIVDTLPDGRPNFRKHEAIYRELLYNLIHPLGTPDTTPRFRPTDLLKHVRKVFQVDRNDHDQYINEESPNKSRNLQVSVTILEANGLKNQNLSEDACSMYCVVSVHNAHAKSRLSQSPFSSPIISHHNSLISQSPNTSPSVTPDMNRRVSTTCYMQQTTTISNCDHPCWNEEFFLDINDYFCNDVNVYVCSQSGSGDGDETRQPEKSYRLKSFLGMIRRGHNNQEMMNNLGCCGRIVIPLKDISVVGTEGWFDIISTGSIMSKPKALGKCHISLGISYKQDCDGGYFSMEDYYQLFLQFLNYWYKNINQSLAAREYKSLMTEQDETLLKMFAEAHRISKLSQAITRVICLLELVTEIPRLDILDLSLKDALDDLQLTWAAMQVGPRNVREHMPLTDTEISHYRRAAGKYIHQRCEGATQDLPDLFPPSVERFNFLKSNLGMTVQLLSLDLWEANCVPQKEISGKILNKLQDDVARWMAAKLDYIVEENETCRLEVKVISEIDRLHEIVDLVTLHCNVLAIIKHFYGCFNINFYKVISSILEKTVSQVCQEVMESMNHYMQINNASPVNMRSASKFTLRLYFALRKFREIILDNFTRREVLWLRISGYQKWFEAAMSAWLQTFNSECVNRMEKALEIDKDVVLVTNLVQYSHSSVDVLSCFATIMDEWRAIDFQQPDGALMGVTKITDILCDGARLYADKLRFILEKNCYYDNKQKTEFDVNDRLCITINNIEHVRNYLDEFPELLSWDTTVMMISTTYKSDDAGVTVYNMLQRLISTANEEILMKNCQLLQQIAVKMWGVMDRYMKVFTRLQPENASSVDQFLGYMSTNLHTLQDQLLPAIFPYMIQELWRITLLLFDQQLRIGKDIAYYEQMNQHLSSLCSQVERHGLDGTMLYTPQYDKLKKCLKLNSKPSMDLMLQYFEDLSANTGTLTEYFGYMVLKVAYREETHGSVTVFVEVVRCHDLPGLDPSGYSDPYVEVSLQPQALFNRFTVQHTSVLKRTLNPVFNALFQFPYAPMEDVKSSGTCVLFSVMDYDRIGWDDFAGEIVVNLSTVPVISFDTQFDKIPTISMPLQRPKRPTEGPFVILNERYWYSEKLEKKFVSRRKRYIEHQPKPTDKARKSQAFIHSRFLNWE